MAGLLDEAVVRRPGPGRVRRETVRGVLPTRVSDQSFIKNPMSMRLEEHLTFEQTLEYIAARSGNEQVMAIASREGETLFEGHIVAVRGELRRLGSTESDAGRVFRAQVGDSSELLLRSDDFEGAARLSMGPEIEAVLIEVAGLRVLLQDVLSVVDSGS